MKDFEVILVSVNLKGLLKKIEKSESATQPNRLEWIFLRTENL